MSHHSEKPTTFLSSSPIPKDTNNSKRTSEDNSEKKPVSLSNHNDDQLVDPDSALNELEPQNWRSLIYANNAEGILELRAGNVDDLIVLATQSTNR